MGNKTTEEKTDVIRVDSSGLLACPFCGNEALILLDDGNKNWWVDCTLYDQIGCGTEGPTAWTEKQAIEKWNKRAG
jgi:hypothetical protein